ncbi:hypothetical protein AUR04nite_16910 [Glutamicibacter uratoxydans]|uniref:Tachylectin 2 domain-containing protein n=2 Tax=Glutamicibacter uratoxydans TaxID=43667 RepID=A0A4Y4DLG3_GLUUR|nr:hypothetical protein AUR04nite_16910 [Glutamicibacter uratoxydans]
MVYTNRMIKSNRFIKAALGVLAAGALSTTLASPAAAYAPAPEGPAGYSCNADMLRGNQVSPGTLNGIQYASWPGSNAGGPGVDAFVNTNPVIHTNLGFNPKALVEKNGFDSRLYATSPTGTLYVVDGYKSTAVNNTWGGIRTMTDVVVTDKYDTVTGVTYTYAITDQGALMRYTQSQGVANMYGTVQVSPRGWGSLKGFSYWMTKTLANGDQADIFLSNASDGRLIEYTIPRATPTKWTSKVVRSSTWQNFVSFSVGNCTDANGNRSRTAPLLATTKAGDVWLYYVSKSTPDALPTVTNGTRISTGFTNSYNG